MLIGNKQDFAIECYHEPISNEGKHIFGRMCLHVSGAELGDINEPTCILNVTKGHLLDAIKNLDTLYDAGFGVRALGSGLWGQIFILDFFIDKSTIHLIAILHGKGIKGRGIK